MVSKYAKYFYAAFGKQCGQKISYADSLFPKPPAPILTLKSHQRFELHAGIGLRDHCR